MIREAKPQFTAKPYITKMKKFLKQISPLEPVEELGLRANRSVDPDYLLKELNEDNAQEALSKMYRIIAVLELMMLKYTEYQMITFLKYDQLYSSLVNQPKRYTNTKLSSIGTGVNISRF